MNVAPLGPRDRCSICATTDELLARMVLVKKPEVMREEFRSHLLVAFIFGVKREVLHMCPDCRKRFEQAVPVVMGASIAR
jgi:uncharacterized protein YlaI